MRPLPANVRELVPPGTRYVTLFLVNGRTPWEKANQDRGFIFQVSMQVTCDDGFVPRRNPRGTRPDDEFDEQVADLQYRDTCEYGVGHGISVSATSRVIGSREFPSSHVVSTAHMPSAEVEKV